MTHNSQRKSKLLLLSIAALGVVYGDIGTSPLYSVTEIFFGPSKTVINKLNVLGSISLIFWALTLIICIKYVIFVLRADSDGEGGVFALSSLIDQIKNKSPKLIVITSALLIFAAGLLFGDGVITPAISVISAVEGLKILSPAFAGYVVPITVIILAILFAVQKFGTSKVGGIFGPIIIIWFLVIGFLGLRQILLFPEIIQAINPYYAITFLHNSQLLSTLFVLGSVMLVITGGEAMYADMGHFGRIPIRISWFSLVFPALLLNYFGQGAYLLGNSHLTTENVFYGMVPGQILIPVIILATSATVIASQALISGAFSLTSQAISLGYLPRLRIIQTHHEHEGQRYVPFINWGLCFGAVLLVILFGSSTRLASLYGFAVSGNMVITTLGLLVIARYIWKWSKAKSYTILIPILSVECLFFISNTLKIIEGGYIPLMVGITLFIIMKIWNWGKNKVATTLDRYDTITVGKLISLKEESREIIPRSIIIMTHTPIENLEDKVPVLEQMLIERQGLVAKHVIFLTVVQHKFPYMHKDRFTVLRIFEDKDKGSITSVKMNFGFMEDPNIEKHLEALAEHHEIHISEHPKNWIIYVIDDKVVINKGVNLVKIIVVKLFQIMDKNSVASVDYFGLGNRVRLSTEVLPVRITK